MKINIFSSSYRLNNNFPHLEWLLVSLGTTKSATSMWTVTHRHVHTLWRRQSIKFGCLWTTFHHIIILWAHSHQWRKKNGKISALIKQKLTVRHNYGLKCHNHRMKSQDELHENNTHGICPPRDFSYSVCYENGLFHKGWNTSLACWFMLSWTKETHSWKDFRQWQPSACCAACNDKPI